MKMPDKINQPELDVLIDDCLEGRLDEADAARLSAHLEQSAEGRTRYWEIASIHGLLEHVMQNASLRAVTGQALPIVSIPDRWLQWRPLTAAAMGLVLGLFCASVVFAYVAPSLGKVTTMLQESFESGPAPLATGVPSEVGVWSGDYSGITAEQQSVQPANGKKMLRFLRGDYEGKSISSSHSSDVCRLVDLRPYRREYADGGAVVQLSAVFNALPFPEDETFYCTLTVFALDASLVGDERLKADNVLSRESLAFSRSSKVGLDRDPGTWQKVSNELRLPPDTDYLMLRMGMSNDTKTSNKRRDSFAGHFADTVHLVIARRPEIPVQ